MIAWGRGKGIRFNGASRSVVCPEVVVDNETFIEYKTGVVDCLRKRLKN